MTDDLDFTSYVAARWTPLVRCLVALGLPLDPAEDCAADALSRCHDTWDDRDEWSDLDGHVLVELFATLEGRRDPWWERPIPAEQADALAEGGWAELEPGLDLMPVPQRRALVLHEVVGLGADQVREVTGVDPPQPAPGRAGALVAALELLPVDPPRIEAMIAESRARRWRRRAAAVGAGVAVVAVAGVVTTVVLRHDAGSAASANALSPVRSERAVNFSPIPFYTDGRLHLEQSVVEVPDVREFATWDDGAVYLDLSGNLVTVDEEGRRERIADIGPEGTFAVSDIDDRVVFVDSEANELVDHDLAAGERMLEVPLPGPAQVAVLEGDRAYLTVDDEFLAVELDDGAIRPAVDWRLPGEVDRYGRLVLSREGGHPGFRTIRLHDTASGQPVPLDLEDGDSVSAAGFTTGGALVLVVEPPGSPISEIRRCSPPYDRCPPIGYFPAGGARALLAR